MYLYGVFGSIYLTRKLCEIVLCQNRKESEDRPQCRQTPINSHRARRTASILSSALHLTSPNAIRPRILLRRQNLRRSCNLFPTKKRIHEALAQRSVIILLNAIRNHNRQVKDSEVLRIVEPEDLVERNIIRSPRTPAFTYELALLWRSVADETRWPDPVHVLDGAALLLRHNHPFAILGRGGELRAVRDGEVEPGRVGGQEGTDGVELGRCIVGVRGEIELAITRDVDG